MRMEKRECDTCNNRGNGWGGETCIACNADYDKYEPIEKIGDNSGTAAGASHYQGRIQPIESMQSVMDEAQFFGYLQGNIIKYASRLGKKGPALTDARKIRQYAEWLVQAIEGKTIDPRA